MQDTFVWESPPEAELERLAVRLYYHLKQAGVARSERTIQKRREFVRAVLQEQGGTCCFAGGDDKYCWNHPHNHELKYLKLEWGHKSPRAHGEHSLTKSNLILQCARCNNHLQSSRTISQLIPEMEHKLRVLKGLKEADLLEG